MHFYEVNFDGLVGPSHNYAGLSFGNIASQNNANAIANPKEAALQGLRKMKSLHDSGLVQGVFAPHARPDTRTLRALGFSGTDPQLISQAAQKAPHLLRACYSASSMWTANAATVSPSADSQDKKVHFTTANLANKFHRAIEAPTTERLLQAMFNDEQHFAHHPALLSGQHFADEGAANHTRLCDSHGHQGLEIFVYGASSFNPAIKRPARYPARQMLEASQAIAHLHQLDQHHTLFLQQNPDVIDMGVFHNDVIAVGNENVLLFHEMAFLNSQSAMTKIKAAYPGQRPLHLIEIKQDVISVEDAVSSYLFNSQLVSLPEGGMALIAPSECQHNDKVATYLAVLQQADNPISQIRYYDLKQSMQNGGGPACLRLRVPLSSQELGAVNQHCLMSESLYLSLTDWVETHYRDRLSDADLADPNLLVECQTALDTLSQLLHLGSVYDFQR